MAALGTGCHTPRTPGHARHEVLYPACDFLGRVITVTLTVTGWDSGALLANGSGLSARERSDR